MQEVTSQQELQRRELTARRIAGEVDADASTPELVDSDDEEPAERPKPAKSMTRASRASVTPSGVRGGMALRADEAEPAETPKTSEVDNNEAKGTAETSNSATNSASESKASSTSSTPTSTSRASLDKNSLVMFAKTTRNELLGAAAHETPNVPSERLFTEIFRSGSLRSLTGTSKVDATTGLKLEVMSAIVDSGATVPVMSPETGKSYELQESVGSKNGVEYEVADGGTLAELGQKLMAVFTAEGTLRGYSTRCADVSKPLQAVRSLVGSQHAVCFGLGDGNDHLIINKVSGEINRMRDDGVNYYQDMLIIPPDRIDEFINAMQQHQHETPAEVQAQHPGTYIGDMSWEPESDFTRRGP